VLTPGCVNHAANSLALSDLSHRSVIKLPFDGAGENRGFAMEAKALPSTLGQIVFVLVFPPIMAALVWLGSRRWANVVQGGNVSDRTKRRQKWEFWVVLTLMYIIVLGFALYAHFGNP